VYFVAFCLSVGLMILCLVGRKLILSLVFGQVEEEIMTQSLVYFRITALSYPFLALQQTSAAQFRAAGNSKLPMTITAIANCVNIVGNGILIFVCGWGVAGAATATLVSRGLSCVALMACQRKNTNLIYVDHYLSIRPDPSVIRLVLRIGIPTAVENGMFQFGRLVVQSTVSTLGTTAIAAQAMTYMMDSFQSMPSQAVGLGILTVLGQCLGAGRIEEAKGYLKKLCLVSEGMLIIMGVLIMLVVRPACVVSGLSTEATDLTVRLVLYITIAKVVLWVPAFSLPNGLRAAGDVNFTAIVSALSMWIVRVGLSFVLCRVMGVGLEGVWYAWFTDWVVRLCFYVYRYRSGKWLEKRVL
jgi:putative MATE family efflux protein